MIPFLQLFFYLNGGSLSIAIFRTEAAAEVAAPGAGTSTSTIAKADALILLDGCGVPVNNMTTEMNEDVGKKKPMFCSDEHRRAVEYCSHDDNNKVLGREGQKIERIRGWGEIRPYSIAPIMPETRPLPPCTSLDDYLSAIKLGTRIWPNSQHAIKEALPFNKSIANIHDTEPSIFIPFDCFVPSLPPPPAKTCDVLNRYNQVIFHGDSLTRHLRQAIYMSISGDFIKGSVHPPKIKSSNVCTCDGQFSERKDCRRYIPYFEEVLPIQPREIPPGMIGMEKPLCHDSTFLYGKTEMAPWLPKRGEVDPGESIDWENVNCEDTNYRGILLVLGGGLHWALNATETFASVVQPVVSNPKYQQCACLGKVRLVWTAMNVQSTVLDKDRPHQSRENAIIFNEETKEAFMSIGLIPGEDVVILDWWNLTADAQYSDGLHYLSDVNLAKAAQILYLAEHWPFAKPRSDQSCKL